MFDDDEEEERQRRQSLLIIVFAILLILLTIMFNGCTFTGNISLSDVDVARRGSETGTTTTTNTTQALDYKRFSLQQIG